MDLESRVRAGRDGRWTRWWAEARELSGSRMEDCSACARTPAPLRPGEHAPSHEPSSARASVHADRDLVRTLLERSTALILVLDGSHNILAASRSFENAITSGRDPTNTSFIDWLDERSREPAVQFLKTLQDHPRQIELSHPEANDTRRVFNYTFRALIFGNDRRVVAVGRERDDPAMIVEELVGHLGRMGEPSPFEHGLTVTTDPLTGLGNRRWVFENMPALFSEAANQGALAWVMIADVDRFKRVNETLGHDAGDQLLVKIGQVLRASVRGGDWVCRYGGDEFLMAGMCHGELELPGLAGRILSGIRNVRFDVDGRPSRITVSLGAALIRPGSHSQPWEVLRAADRAIRRAKDAGRDRYDVEPGVVEQPSP